MDAEERNRRAVYDRIVSDRLLVYGPQACACGCGRTFPPTSRSRRYFNDRCARRDAARRARAREATGLS